MNSTPGDFNAAYLRVAKMTKHVDIFSKKVLFIPVNDHSHWVLLMICNPGLFSNEETPPYAVIFDSIRGNVRTKRVLKTIRLYLQEEWKATRQDVDDIAKPITAKSLPGFAPRVPPQRNQCDCGVFLVEYFERLLCTHLESVLNIVDTAESVSKATSVFNSEFGIKWFGDADIARRRYDLFRFLSELKNGFN